MKTERPVFPPAESQGTFKRLLNHEQVRETAGFDPQRLAYARHYQEFLNAGDSFGVLILRNGWAVDEYYTENILETTSIDIWSATKSFTSLAYGMLLDRLSPRVSLESRLYDHLPREYFHGDGRRKNITIRHLLSMTSGIRGSGNGVIGMGVPHGVGAFEYALGMQPNRFGLCCDPLLSDPGCAFDYSDASYALLALLFYHLSGEDMRDFLARELFLKLGMQSAHWDLQGGYGAIGPYTNGHTGLHISVRELARVGYLVLNHGKWDRQQVLPGHWIETAIDTKDSTNPCYGLGFWVNHTGRLIPKAPHDLFFMKGYRSNRCYIVPSLDLVVARCGTGPTNWDESKLIGDIIDSIIQ